MQIKILGNLESTRTCKQRSHISLIQKEIKILKYFLCMDWEDMHFGSKKK
jgi:hypothetical protein